MTAASCERFDESVAELALGILDGPEETALQDHAAGCARCRAELDSLIATADRLATVAPDAEPPVGFEQRALATMAEPLVPVVARRHVASRVLAGAAAVVLLVVGGFFLLRGDGGGALDGSLLASDDGRDAGVVTVTPRGERQILSMVLVGVDPGRYHCSVVTDAGTTFEVAAWTVRRRGTDTWDVPLPTAAEHPDEVVLTDDDGHEVARADLH